MIYLHLAVHAFETRVQALHGFIWRGEEFKRLVNMADKPVGSFANTGNVEAATEHTSAFEHPKGLLICRMFIWKSVETIK